MVFLAYIFMARGARPTPAASALPLTSPAPPRPLPSPPRGGARTPAFFIHARAEAVYRADDKVAGLWEKQF